MINATPNQINIVETSPGHYQMGSNIPDKVAVIGILLDLAKNLSTQIVEKKLIEIPQSQVILQ